MVYEIGGEVVATGAKDPATMFATVGILLIIALIVYAVYQLYLNR